MYVICSEEWFLSIQKQPFKVDPLYLKPQLQLHRYARLDISKRKDQPHPPTSSLRIKNLFKGKVCIHIY